MAQKRKLGVFFEGEHQLSLVGSQSCVSPVTNKSILKKKRKKQSKRENLERMKRQPPPAYGDGSMNPYGGGGGQRMRGNTGTMSNSYGGGGRQEGYSNVEAEQHPGLDIGLVALKLLRFRIRKWRLIFVCQGGNGARSYYHGPPHDPKSGLENQSNKEASRIQPHEQDMELGFEDNSLPISFEGLERKFLDEVMKLAKEQSDAEDVEKARHRE
ncbi:hypothetical protein NC653_026422 [Populus alba x Populus x berolinensis]|uniref:Uncharacterized protein n=1 Tax=Populus alba x Populus x berolinensis TaxID=444605 RepID=A0AAD6MDL7_9ROSI|nr:hypothetical protein NC653_026422 [Populus alba x Populus x berolinensis]